MTDAPTAYSREALVKQLLLHEGIRRIVSYVHDDGWPNLRQSAGQIWERKHVDPATVTPLLAVSAITS